MSAQVREAIQSTGSARYVTSRVIPASQDSLEEKAALQLTFNGAADERGQEIPPDVAPTQEQSLLQWSRAVGVELLKYGKP